MKFTLSFLFIFAAVLSFAQSDIYQPIIPKGYIVYKTNEAIIIDGKADEKIWSEVDFTDPFIDIEGDKKPAPFFETKVKMLWDDENFYFYARLEEEHIWGDITERDAIIYLNNDFEIFLKPGLQWAHYAEFEVNALGTPWDLLLLNTYREGGPINFNWNIDGLQVGVHNEGTINDYSDADKYWSVEIAMPWKVLLELYPGQKFIDKVPKP
ncbi:MAG: carbohydrate-binding family 9-like protein [Bacteroidales bacterium]|nr:carbohydrate-binding family 9-like protein [Bacteroidales bacterium]